MRFELLPCGFLFLLSEEISADFKNAAPDYFLSRKRCRNI